MIPGEVRLLQTSRDLYRLAFLVFVLSIGLNLCISFFRFRKKSFETGKEAEFREKQVFSWDFWEPSFLAVFLFLQIIFMEDRISPIICFGLEI